MIKKETLAFGVALTIGIIISSGSALAARWVAQIERDDFGDNHTGIAITTSQGRALGLRCENTKVPTLIFATRERWGDGLSLLPAELLLRIDDGETIRKQATLERYPMMIGLSQDFGVRVLALGDHLFPVIEQIAKARHRISVAVEVGGQRFENTRFSPRGSTNAIKKIWHYCGSKFGDYKKPTL